MNAVLASTVLAAVLALAGAPAHAAADPPQHLRIDTAGTPVEFSLRLMLVKRLQGRFPLVEGEVRLFPERDRASIEVRIDAREVMMARAAWSEWARSPEFFDAQRHPWIRFAAEDVPLSVFRDGGALQGTVNLRGMERPVELTLQPSPCPRPGTECPVHAEGELSRSEFGMSARRFVLGDKVRLRFEIRVHAHEAPEPAQ